MNRNLILFLISGLFVLGSLQSTAAQPTAQHLAAVKTAQQKSMYAITNATNGCPFATTDMLGWPASLTRECIYEGGPLKGYVLLLDIKPEVIATWIETECAKLLPQSSQCFQLTLDCGKATSGMMFPISGNVLEDMAGPWRNWFFRNGMTVRMKAQENNTGEHLTLERQKELALMPESEIERIPSGITRLWRTMPGQFAARFPREDVPRSLETPLKRQQWLNITRAEILAALQRPNNRLLEAWIAAHKATLSLGRCPLDHEL